MLLTSSLILSGLDFNGPKRNRLSVNTNFLSPFMTHQEADDDFPRDDILETSNIYLVDFESVSSAYNTIFLQLKEAFEKSHISAAVYKTSYDLIRLLPESILFKLEEDNIYTTEYGTLVIDWEIEGSNDEFSLEIGNDCFGYFSELNGKDIVNVEEVPFSSEEVAKLHQRIEAFYQR